MKGEGLLLGQYYVYVANCEVDVGYPTISEVPNPESIRFGRISKNGEAYSGGTVCDGTNLFMVVSDREFSDWFRQHHLLTRPPPVGVGNRKTPFKPTP